MSHSHQKTLASPSALSISPPHSLLPRHWITIIRANAAIIALSPIVLLLEIIRCLLSLKRWMNLLSLKRSSFPPCRQVDEAQFPDAKFFEKVITKLENSGLRSTASKAHERFMTWIEAELGAIPGLEITSDEYEILRWAVADGQNLKDAGSLVITDDENGLTTTMEIAGVVPYSKPSDARTSKLIYVPIGTSLLSGHVKGKIIVRDLVDKSIPMVVAQLPSYYMTKDLRTDSFGNYKRPSFWEIPMHQDLVNADKAGAAGVVFLIDFPRSQFESYWDPHQGTHYTIPAVFCASEDVAFLKQAASRNLDATIAVNAEVSRQTTRNILATLPGRSEETIVYVTHTDGNTCVQDNGVAALLALARYFSEQPLSSRHRNLQFAFNTAHLHVSKEGSGRHAQQLDATYDHPHEKLALVIPVEHLGTRELEAQPSPDGNGRVLKYTSRGEAMIWCVGPSRPLTSAVITAVKRHNLDRVMITRGIGMPSLSKVPTFTSFGGLGTLYHNHLLPTTSLISGPWSLFAPCFGVDSVDVGRMRRQCLALGDVYLCMEGLSRSEIAGGYTEYRARRREMGRKVYTGFEYPPETL